MIAALLSYALAQGHVAAHASNVLKNLDPIEQTVVAKKLDVTTWTPLRERWAGERLARRGLKSPELGAWRAVSPHDRLELALREAVDAEVDREVESLAYFDPDIQRRLGETDGWANKFLLDLFGSKARSPFSQSDVEEERVRGALRSLAHRTVSLQALNKSPKSRVSNPRTLDAIIAYQAAVVGRLLMRAADARATEFSEEAAFAAASALHVLARAHLLMGANAGTVADVAGDPVVANFIRTLNGEEVEVFGRFKTLQNLRELFWAQVTPYYLAVFPDAPAGVAPIVEETSPQARASVITQVLMRLSREPEGVQCDRLLGSLHRQLALRAEATRDSARRGR